MIIDKYNSQKIKILSFVAIAMVVYIHGYFLEAENMFLSNHLQLFGSALTSVAVPLFYAISGFLFFNNIHGLTDCFPKIKKRARTLFVPYLIWNVVFVLWYVVLNYLPGISRYVNSDILSELSLSKPWDTLYFLFVKPAGFQMWFLRDLILFVVCSPVIFVCIKRFKWFAYIFLLLSTGFITRFWMTSFVFGGILALEYKNPLDIFREGNRKRFLFFPLFVSVLYCIVCTCGTIPKQATCLNNYIAQIVTIMMICAIWGCYDLFVHTDYCVTKSMEKVIGYTFFIYLFHEPAFNIIKKIGLMLLGCSELSLIVLYIVNPWIMVCFAVIVGNLFKKNLPRVYAISVGGR